MGKKCTFRGEIKKIKKLYIKIKEKTERKVIYKLKRFIRRVAIKQKYLIRQRKRVIILLNKILRRIK